MINAKDFVEAARELGFGWYCGVPCSYLTPFINYVINDQSLNYVSAANEGDAVATACGITMGGKRAVAMMQNSGLGNAVSPLTSLSYIFNIPILLICTHRGQPGIADEPQHELMGQVTTELFDTMRIPWEKFPDQADQIAETLSRANQYMLREGKPYALIMSKGTVAAETLLASDEKPAVPNAKINASKQNQNSPRPSRYEVLEKIIAATNIESDVLIATTGFTGRELYSIDDRNNHFYMVGSMGCASSLGLGLALARPEKRVIVIDGDGAGLMRMGNFATVGKYAGGNLLHILLDNEAHDSTGAQSTVSGSIDFAAIASACGYRHIYRAHETAEIETLLQSSSTDGPIFAHLKIGTGTIENLPRPKVKPGEVYTRLNQLING